MKFNKPTLWYLFLTLSLCLSSVKSQEPLSLQGRMWQPGMAQPTQRVITIQGDRVVDLGTGRNLVVDGLILPGLIDLHDHIKFAYAPSFQGRLWPRKRIFANRYQWQKTPEVRQFMQRHSQLAESSRSRLERLGLVRELVGGTTSVADGVSDSNDSIWIRNLSGEERRHGLPQYVEDVVFFLNRDALLESPARFVISPYFLEVVERAELVLLHLAEGRRDDSLTGIEVERFLRWTEENPELAQRVVIVHGVGLTKRDLSLLYKRGVNKLVWSPVSNLELYDQTLLIEDALSLGFQVALGTDWRPSGSDNLFQELRAARAFCKDNELSVRRRSALHGCRQSKEDIGGASIGNFGSPCLR